MMRIIAVSALVASTVRSLQLTSVGLPKEISQDKKSCKDIHGNYIDKKGKPVSVFQNGCFVKVKMDFDGHSVSIVPGYMGSSSVHIKDFKEAGSFTDAGDITFADGGLWKKLNARDGTTVLADSDSLTAASYQDNPEDVVAIAPQCKEVSGEYSDKFGRAVTIEQKGCAISVHHGEGVVAGTIDNQLHFADQAIPGLISEGTGDIFFSDGTHWYKAASPMADSSVADTILSDSSVASSSSQDQAVQAECPDVHGKYQNDAGNEVTVYQIKCFVKVKIYWDEKLGTVLKPGHIKDNSVIVKDFSTPGAVAEDGVISFGDGGWWKKVGGEVATAVDSSAPANDAQATTIFKAPEASTAACRDLKGSYLDKLGKAVSIDQIGCDVMVKREDEDLELSGNIANDELSISGTTDNGHFADTGDIFFSDGGHWFKQETVEARTDEVANLSSVMAGESADTIMREGVSDSASAEAAASLEGAQSPEDAPFVMVDGTQNTTSNTSIMEDMVKDIVGDIVAALPDNASTQADATQTEDCSDVHGRYTNAEGQYVTVYQAGCLLKIQMFSEESNGDVLKSGRIAGEVMRVQDVEHAGMATNNGDIFFADGTHWTKADAMVDFPDMANLSDFPSSPVVEAANLSDNVSTEAANISSPIVEATNLSDNVSTEAANISADGATLDSVAQDFSPMSSTDNCTDIHGSYYNKQDLEVTIYQVGCFLKVRMFWDDEVGEVLKPGRIVGQDFRVQDFRKAGRVTEGGELFFGDNKSWSKTKPDEKAVYYATAAVSGATGQGLPNTALVNVALANSTGNFSYSVGKSADESNTSTNSSANSTFANASELNISLNSTLSSTSSVVQEAGDDDEDFLVDENCPDVTGTYETQQGGETQEVTVYQIGCFLKVKGIFNGEPTLKSGKIQGDFMYVKDVQMPGIMSLSGDILFGNGTDWKKTSSGDGHKAAKSNTNETAPANDTSSKSEPQESGNQTSGQADQQNPGNPPLDGSDFMNVSNVSSSVNSSLNLTINSSANSSTNSSANDWWSINHSADVEEIGAAETLTQLHSNQVDILQSVDQDALHAAQPCPNAGGHYVTSVGKLISVEQTGCNLDVQLWWDNTHGEVLAKGAIKDKQVRIEGFLELGFITDQSIAFPAGASWRKLTASELAEVKKDGCGDVDGYYGDGEGSVVKVSQTGCHAAVKVVTGSSEAKPKLGRVVENELHLFDHSTPGARTSDGSLDFGASAFWTKLSEQQATDAADDHCNSAAGHYRDGRGNIATVGQEGCNITVQMFWDDATGNVTLAGQLYGDSLYVKEFRAQALLKEETGSGAQLIDFADSAAWHKMSDQEVLLLKLPEAGCENYDGLYVDNKGKQVQVAQTGCHLKVSGNVVGEGHVSRGTMHLSGLDDGEKSEFGISFGANKHWTMLR